MDVYRFRVSGFTLIELVLVILIMSILAIFVSINSPVNAYNTAIYAEQLAVNLRYAQSLSMTMGARYCVILNGSSYQILNSHTGIAANLPSSSHLVSLAKGLSWLNLNPVGLSMIVFDGQGAPYYSLATTCTASNADSATALTALLTLALTDGTDTKSVMITPQTGRVYTQ